ncbi:UvrD-helicase domain-containing protein [Sulfuricurvum sp.]|uniref:UvrD-helicase domain-containing protein n=1 Tax=Sulfuricurvum sp. TaxID=2025608 RepID=UPI0025F3D5A9|nr:UvrD-helicase domain-containing protein [Sulfuricurvum sp.]
MISNNIQKIKDKEQILYRELNQLKIYTPNWLWQTILRTISFGYIDLNDKKQKKIHSLSFKLKQLKEEIEQFVNIEINLDILENEINSIYINNYKKILFYQRLLHILGSNENYEISNETKKYPSISSFFINQDLFIKRANDLFIEKEKKDYSVFFETVEANPLTENQKNAVLINEDNNLVIAGAGSGKTSVIVAKIGYLTKRNFAEPEDILVLAFNKKAVEEIEERITEKLNIKTNISTFHAFGLHIIGETSKKPIICSWAVDDKELNKLIRNIIKEKLTEVDFFKLFKKYFLEHFVPYKNEFDFKNKGEYYDYIKNYDLRTLNGELVKSYEECEISNFLRLKNINYIYEHRYEFETSTSQYRQYQPDFYLPDYDIYIEHFGISKDNKTAPYIDNEKYLAGIQWKRNIHNQYKTKLIETYSYEKTEGKLLYLLESKLKSHGVVLEDIPFEDALAIFNQSNGAVDRFTKLTIQFLNHFKSNNFTIDTIEKRINFLDFRTKAFLNIFETIFNEYEKKKQEANCIDFYDMINDAVSILQSKKYKTKYKYILID